MGLRYGVYDGKPQTGSRIGVIDPHETAKDLLLIFGVNTDSLVTYPQVEAVGAFHRGNLREHLQAGSGDSVGGHRITLLIQ